MESTSQKFPFLEKVRRIMRTQHYAIRTETAYIDWTRRYILFQRERHPAEMGEPGIAGFLTHLAVNRQVAQTSSRP